MSYRRGPVFYFKDDTETGMDKVPVGYLVVLQDGSAIYVLTDKTGITDASTVANVVALGTAVTEVSGGGSSATIAATIAPTVSSAVETINEGTTATVTITNWFDSITYVVETLDGTKATISRVGNELTITGLAVVADTSTAVRVNATAAGLAVSTWVTIDVNVISVPVVADDAIADALTTSILNTYTEGA